MAVRFKQILEEEPEEELEERSAKDKLRQTTSDLVGALVSAWARSKSGTKGCGVCQKEAKKLRGA